MAGAIIKGWQDYFHALDELKQRRKENQSRRSISDRMLYQLQNQAPAPLIKNGAPLLTWDTICFHYSPLIYSGLTFELPELDGLDENERVSARNASQSLTLQRIRHLWRNEGPGGMLYRLGKQIQWRIMQT